MTLDILMYQLKTDPIPMHSQALFKTGTAPFVQSGSLELNIKKKWL